MAKKAESIPEILSVHQNGERWFNRQLASSGSVVTADMGMELCNIYTRHLSPFKASKILVNAALGYIPDFDHPDEITKLEDVIAEGLPLRVAPIINGTMFNFVWAIGDPKSQTPGESYSERMSHAETADKIYLPLDIELEGCVLLPVNSIRIATV